MSRADEGIEGGPGIGSGEPRRRRRTPRRPPRPPRAPDGPRGLRRRRSGRCSSRARRSRSAATATTRGLVRLVSIGGVGEGIASSCLLAGPADPGERPEVEPPRRRRSRWRAPPHRWRRSRWPRPSRGSSASRSASKPGVCAVSRTNAPGASRALAARRSRIEVLHRPGVSAGAVAVRRRIEDEAVVAPPAPGLARDERPGVVDDPTDGPVRQAGQLGVAAGPGHGRARGVDMRHARTRPGEGQRREAGVGEQDQDGRHLPGPAATAASRRARERARPGRRRSGGAPWSGPRGRWSTARPSRPDRSSRGRGRTAGPRHRQAPGSRRSSRRPAPVGRRCGRRTARGGRRRRHRSARTTQHCDMRLDDDATEGSGYDARRRRRTVTAGTAPSRTWNTREPTETRPRGADTGDVGG